MTTQNCVDKSVTYLRYPVSFGASFGTGVTRSTHEEGGPPHGPSPGEPQSDHLSSLFINFIYYVRWCQ